MNRPNDHNVMGGLMQLVMHGYMDHYLVADPEKKLTFFKTNGVRLVCSGTDWGTLEAFKEKTLDMRYAITMDIDI